ARSRSRGHDRGGGAQLAHQPARCVRGGRRDRPDLQAGRNGRRIRCRGCARRRALPRRVGGRREGSRRRRRLICSAHRIAAQRHIEIPIERKHMSTKAVTDATFADEVLSSEKPIMVDFWATWCGPCRAVSPILDKIAEEHADKISIVKLDVDDNPETAMKYGITSIPAMYVFQNGEIVKRVIGAKPKPALEADLAEFLA